MKYQKYRQGKIGIFRKKKPSQSYFVFRIFLAKMSGNDLKSRQWKAGDSFLHVVSLTTGP